MPPSPTNYSRRTAIRTSALTLRELTEAAALDDTTLRLTFSGKQSSRTILDAAIFPILSKAYFDRVPFDCSRMEPPLGSGPYKVGLVRAGQTIEYERVADYWGRDLPVNRGIYNFDRLRVEFYGDRQAAFEAFKKGEILFREEATSRIWATSYDFPAIKAGKVVKREFPSEKRPAMQATAVNQRRERFRDVRVRRAIALCFDFEWTNKSLFYGLYDRSQSCFERSEFKATGVPSAQELVLLEPMRDRLPPEVFGEAYQLPPSNGSGRDRKQLGEARRLMAEAGWKPAGRFFQNEKGETFTLEILVDDEEFIRIYSPWVESLRAIGFDASLRQVDSAQHQARQVSFDFDMISMALLFSPTPTRESMDSIFHSKSAELAGSRNLSGTAEPAIDMLVEAIAGVTNRQELTTVLNALDRVLRARMDWIPSWYSRESPRGLLGHVRFQGAETGLWLRGRDVVVVRQGQGGGDWQSLTEQCESPRPVASRRAFPDGDLYPPAHPFDDPDACSASWRSRSLVIQFAPGGPVEQVIAKLTGQGGDRLTGGGGDAIGGGGLGEGGEMSSKYRGAQGLDPEFIAKLEKQFGFDKPPLERFGMMLWNYIRFDFGDSYFRDISVLELILEKMPVSISIGLWITLLSYLISIPLGIRKAVKDGSAFDVWTSGVVIVGYAIPGFLFGIMLMVLFAGGSFFDWFPLRGLTSDNFDQLSLGGKILDYFWHMTLPLTAMVLSAFATTTLLTKNSFLDEIRKQYVITARAKGLSERQVLYGHVFRNAMLIVIAGFPGAFISAFFTGSLLIENIFSLDGLGPARLPLRARPRLSGRLRHPLHLLADRPVRQPDLRPDLYLDRSAHRFRAEGRLMAIADAMPVRRETAVAVAAQPAPLAEFQGEPARLLVAVDLPRAVRPVAGCRVHRQRQADPRLLQGRAALACPGRLSGGEVRRLLAL